MISRPADDNETRNGNNKLYTSRIKNKMAARHRNSNSTSMAVEQSASRSDPNGRPHSRRKSDNANAQILVTQLCQLTARYDIPLQDISWSRCSLSPNWLIVNHHHNNHNQSNPFSKLTLLNPNRTQSRDPIHFNSTVPVVRAEAHPKRDLIALSTAPTMTLISDTNQQQFRPSDRRRSSVTSVGTTRLTEALLTVFVIHSGCPVNSIDLLSLQVDNNLNDSNDGLHLTMNNLANQSLDYDFFWTWITADLIGIVTREAVFHWDVFDADSIPLLVHKRHAKMAAIPTTINSNPVQITGYIADETCQWFALTGLTTNSNSNYYNNNNGSTNAEGVPHLNAVTPTASSANFSEFSAAAMVGVHGAGGNHQSAGPDVAGLVQIYSRRDDYSQLMELHACHLTRHTLAGNSSPSTLLIGARRTSHTAAKIHLTELGPIAAGNLALVSRSESILWYGSAVGDVTTTNTETTAYEGDLSASDFPSLIRTSPELGLIYILSKRGVLFVADLDSGTHLLRTAVLPLGDILSGAVYDADTSGLTALTRNGSLLALEPNVPALVAALEATSSRRFIAARLRDAHHTLIANSDLVTTRL